MYQEGDMTHFNQKLENFQVRRCWKECMEKSDFLGRKTAVETFNSKNRYHNLYKLKRNSHIDWFYDNNCYAIKPQTPAFMKQHFDGEKQLTNLIALSRWRKRGIACLPTKFAVAYQDTFLNQGGALVHVYTDGSVYLTHGGTEMGQGLHTKMVQVIVSSFYNEFEVLTEGYPDVANHSQR